MVRFILLVLIISVSVALLYVTYLAWHGSNSVVAILDTAPAKRLFLTGFAINSVNLLLSLILFFWVPDDRRVIYGALTTFLGLFSFVVVSLSSGFFNRPFELSYLGMRLVATQGSSTDQSFAMVTLAVLLVLSWRELKKTPATET
jgi:hypothetical protein